MNVFREKTYVTRTSVVVLILVFFLSPAFAYAADELQPIGTECTDSDQCLSDHCEKADTGISYCTCTETTAVDSTDCEQEFGEIAGGWECNDGKFATYDLNYCVSDDNVTTPKFPLLPLRDPTFVDSFINPVLNSEAIKQLQIEPTTRISIPGLNFSEITARNEEEGGVIYIPFLSDYISAVYRWGIAAGAIVAVVMIIRGGLIWVLSAGSKTSIEHAKKIIGSALIGLTLAVGSYTILYTINPNFVQFKNLRVKHIADDSIGKVLISANNDASPLSAGNCDAFDEAFQRYAPCLGSDWRALKAIARVESGCNPTARNSAGFVGMGQTKPKYCKSIFKNRGYKKWEDYCTEQNLMTPNMGIAVIALLQKNTAKLIKKHCPNATPLQQGAMFHAFNNVPAAAKRMIVGGCTNKEDFVSYYHAGMRNEGGYLNTTAYKKKFGHLLPNKEAYLRAIGTAKIDYALSKAGPTFEAFGGDINGPRPLGQCPLDTNDPF